MVLYPLQINFQQDPERVNERVSQLRSTVAGCGKLDADCLYVDGGADGVDHQISSSRRHETAWIKRHDGRRAELPVDFDQFYTVLIYY